MEREQGGFEGHGHIQRFWALEESRTFQAYKNTRNQGPKGEDPGARSYREGALRPLFFEGPSGALEDRSG